MESLFNVSVNTTFNMFMDAFVALSINLKRLVTCDTFSTELWDVSFRSSVFIFNDAKP